MEFIKRVVKHFARNGIIELHELAKPPYTDIDDQGLFGVFNDDRQDKIIEIIEKINDIGIPA